MARRAFYSFEYRPDNSRASQVRNMGVIEGNVVATDNDWEAITRGGDAAIQRWIDGQMVGKSVVIVLIGATTAGRKWINYEIQKGWADRKGLLGVHIHGLRDFNQRQSSKGANPFAGFSIGNVNLASIVKSYDPPFYDSKQCYAHIRANLGSWIEDAVLTRSRY